MRLVSTPKLRASAIAGGGTLRATDLEVPADFSSAAFFIVGASIVPGSELVLRGVGVDPRRTGLLEVLRRMGADIRVGNADTRGGFAVADIVVRSAALRGIMGLADRANQYVDTNKPWALAKDPAKAAEVLAVCTQGINLFRHFHGANLGRHGSSASSRDLL